jgi:hypothetical protein
MSNFNKNWISNQQNNISYPEKINRLLEVKDKLVLVQVHELEKYKKSKHGNKKPVDQCYIDQLYKHYIIEGKPKLYMCN